MKILLAVLVAVVVASCGGADDGDSSASTTTTPDSETTTSEASSDEPSDDQASDTDGAGEPSVGTLTIDGEEYDVVLGADVVLNSWDVQSPRDPCGLDASPISVVLLHDGSERFIFVAEGPSADDLSLTLVNDSMAMASRSQSASAAVGAGTFEFSGTLEGDMGPTQVEVAVSC